MTSLINPSFSWQTYVFTGNLFWGASSKIDIGLIVNNDICNVLGIGVADNDRTSKFLAISLILSFCATPNFCSSSTTRSPNSLNLTSWDRSLCVPMTKSIFPALKSPRVCFSSLELLNLFNIPILTPVSLNLCFATSKCCLESTVVGHNKAAWYPFITALNIALKANSVFPNPTSPAISLSIGCGFSIYADISFQALFWDKVKG